MKKNKKKIKKRKLKKKIKLNWKGKKRTTFFKFNVILNNYLIIKTKNKKFKLYYIKLNKNKLRNP